MDSLHKIHIALQGHDYPPEANVRKELIDTVRRVIGPIATPDTLHWAPGLPKTRSGKIMSKQRLSAVLTAILLACCLACLLSGLSVIWACLGLCRHFLFSRDRLAHLFSDLLMLSSVANAAQANCLIFDIACLQRTSISSCQNQSCHMPACRMHLRGVTLH